MKKLLLFIAIAMIANNILAQTECSTIAEVRALKNETSVKYTGTATTTFYGVGGILIEDETGYLYLKNAMLAESGSSEVRTNMEITNISGTFKFATDEDMTHIEVSNRSINTIEIINEDVPFNITDVAITDFLNDPIKYECQPIRLSNVDVKSNGWTYFLSADDKEITLVAGWGVTIPSRGTFEGYYGNNGTQGFIIPSANHVTATAFMTLTNLKEAYETTAPNTLEVIEPMLVNYVKTNTDNSLDVYVQQTDNYEATTGVVLHIDQYNGTINAGDSILGIKGLFSAFMADDNNKITNHSNIKITADDAKSITIINSNNKTTPTLIDDLEYVIGWGTKNYESLLAISPKGEITKKNNKYYLTSGNNSIALSGIDFTTHEGENIAVVGIIDAGNINTGETTLILRSEKDLLATSYTFNSIAELKAAGEPIATGVTYTLANTVLVTNIQTWKVEEINVYGIFVQDENAGLYIETQGNPNIQTGDSISGITGSYHGYLAQKSDAKFTIISSNHLANIEYDEVTMATLKTNPEKYASRVVKLMGVEHGSREVNNYGEISTQHYLFQEKDTMVYDIWDYELFEKNNIIGVFDYGSYQNFSIVPLSQEHIENALENTPINNVEAENLTFIDGSILTVPNASNIKLYSLSGICIANTNGNKLNIAEYNTGIYIVIAETPKGISSTKITIK